MQNSRPLLHLAQQLISTSSRNKSSLLRNRFRSLHHKYNINQVNSWSSYRLFASDSHSHSHSHSSHKAPLPEKVDLQAGDNAVGLEALEQHFNRRGKHLTYQAVLTGPFGTIENPVIVPTAKQERFVGCCGGNGEHGEPEEHDPVWFLATPKDSVACPVCAQVFRLTPDKFPDEFYNALGDEHLHPDSNSIDVVHHLEITPATSKDVENILMDGYSLKHPLKVSEYLNEVLSPEHMSHGKSNKHTATASAGHGNDAHNHGHGGHSHDHGSHGHKH